MTGNEVLWAIHAEIARRGAVGRLCGIWAEMNGRNATGAIMERTNGNKTKAREGKTKARNGRANRLTEFNGEEMTEAEWDEYEALARGVMRGVVDSVIAFLDRYGGEEWRK